MIAIAPVYIHLGNAKSGEVDAVGPFDFVEVIRNGFVRVQNGEEYSGDFTIATWAGGAWRLDDGSLWTSLTISTQPRPTA